MESGSTRIERSLGKIVLVLVGCLVLLSATAYVGMRLFRAWQERRLLAEANALVQEGDLKRASFDAQRVLVINSQSAGANRVLADVGERSGVRAAIDFRRRVAELSNNDARDLLAWVRCALRFGDAATAAKVLESLPAPVRESAEYHALRGDLALLQRDAISYERELSRACELDPANKSYRLALATLHLNSAQPSLHERGIHDLEELRGDKSLRQVVTRRLAEDALRRREKDKALIYAAELNKLQQTDFSDRLLLLSAQKLAAEAQWRSTLAQLQKEAGQDATKCGALLGWMDSQGMATEALGWIRTLPAELLGKKTLPLTVADTYLAAGDWAGLQKFLRGGNWGPAEYLRSALLARASREMGRTEESAQEWNQAVRDVNGHSEEIFLLAEMARKWGWETEALNLLWLAADDPQKADQTLSALYRIYAAKGDTAELYRVLLHLEELRPTDSAILNNIAQLSLLLNLNTERAYQLARQVHEENATNADYTSTYAFSLYRRGESKKAVQAFAAVPEVALRRPQIAAYYGIILAAAGDFTRARDFLALGERANLLPEERALVEKAQTTVAPR